MTPVNGSSFLQPFGRSQLIRRLLPKSPSPVGVSLHRRTWRRGDERHGSNGGSVAAPQECLDMCSNRLTWGYSEECRLIDRSCSWRTFGSAHQHQDLMVSD